MAAFFRQGGQVGQFRLRMPQEYFYGFHAGVSAGPNNRYTYHDYPFYSKNPILKLKNVRLGKAKDFFPIKKAVVTPTAFGMVCKTF
jgi:hypothetical protein